MPRTPRGSGSSVKPTVRVTAAEWEALHETLATRNAARPVQERALSVRDVILSGIHIYLETDNPSQLPF